MHSLPILRFFTLRMMGSGQDLRHRWDLSPREAVQLQKELARKVVLQPLPLDFDVLAAADLSYFKGGTYLAAVIVTFRWPDLSPIETVHVKAPVKFPYVPGLLSFREIPALLEAFQRLRTRPDVFLCDGQGLAHPRKFGLACHLGLVLDLPAVGCAKSRLCGEHPPLELRKGHSVPLVLNGERVGSVYCSRTGVKPLYISPGHLADLPSSEELVSHCVGRFRIPEPLRRAHAAATALREGRALT